jgi:hypothetical protein
LGSNLSSLEIRKTKKMIEVVKHSLGLCGENHISLLNISSFLVGIIGYFSYIKFEIKNKLKLWKNKKQNQL